MTNTTRIFQWIVGEPKTSCFIGAIGLDKSGMMIKRSLQKENINFLFEEINSLGTGQCLVLVNEADRSLVTDLSASKYLTYEHLKKNEVWNVLKHSKYLYISAFLLEIFSDLPEFLNEVLMDQKLVFNIGASFLCRKHKEAFRKIIPLVDILFGNACEIEELANCLGFETNDLDTRMLKINGWKKVRDGRRITVITQGPDPVHLAFNGVVFKYNVECVKLKDSSCAGDAFVGGFMAMYYKGKAFEDCVNCGIWAAGEIIQNYACTFDLNKKFNCFLVLFFLVTNLFFKI